MALVMLAGGRVCALVMTIVGLPTMRARGLTFAVTTLALALVTSSYLLNPAFFSSWLPEGRIERTRFFGTISVESERAAQAYGIDARRAVVVAFAFSGFISGVAGALFVHQQRAIDLANFAPEAGLRVFSMVVVGGLGSMAGAIAGAIYVSGIDWFLPPEWSFLATGAGMLLVLMLLPGGLGGALGDTRDGALRWFARRRGIRVPSLVADTLVPSPDLGNPAPEPHADSPTPTPSPAPAPA